VLDNEWGVEANSDGYSCIGPIYNKYILMGCIIYVNALLFRSARYKKAAAAKMQYTSTYRARWNVS
jgi:hypothetical protein